MNYSQKHSNSFKKPKKKNASTTLHNLSYGNWHLSRIIGEGEEKFLLVGADILLLLQHKQI